MDMDNTKGSCNCSSTGGCCDSTSRRGFLKTAGFGAAALVSGLPVMAGPFEADEFSALVPADKKLSPEFVQSLLARGSRTVYRDTELAKIGMPIGGLCAGLVYLGGDGKLWLWDIFNQRRSTGGENYAKPLLPEKRFEQGFALRVTAGGKTQTRALDRSGFSDVTFCGEYPIGYVEYRDPGCPATVSLEAFSPFIPLNTDESSLPATVMRFTVRNVGQEPIDVDVAGWLENAAALHNGAFGIGTRRNQIVREETMTLLQCSAEARLLREEEMRPSSVFEDFEGGYEKWTVEGEAFGTRPSVLGDLKHSVAVTGSQGKQLVDSLGASSDGPVGKMTSKPFVIERRFINFLIGGGQHPGETCMNLLVDGQIVRTAMGKNTEVLAWQCWNVCDLEGKTAQIEIVDRQSGGWGHIMADQIEFADRPRLETGSPEKWGDLGTMGLAFLGDAQGVVAAAAVSAGAYPQSLWNDAGLAADSVDNVPLQKKLTGAISKRLSLQPGGEATVTFAIVWHFPNLIMDKLGEVGRSYAARFADATAVAQHLAKNIESLSAQTRLWHDTWYDATLPYWLLDRTMANTSILASTTSYRFANGRFYGYEGVGCCEGTCGHVWQYAQAPARLFPELERSVREMVDFGAGFHPDTGIIEFRAEHGCGYAADAQAGYVLRTYREHQMSPDDAFLRRVWPKAKKALQYLIEQDANGDGILEGAQHNTLDVNLYGPSSWLSSLYVAALRAGKAMAVEMGDTAFAEQTQTIADAGSKNIVERLFNGEYFIHKPDVTHPEGLIYGNGCEIDQVMGQSWAFQVGLDRVIDQEHSRKALEAIWKYNFTPDVGPYRGKYTAGRWFAMAGEGGLLMCTFPKGDREKILADKPVWATMYYNECMSGFEWEAIWHMMAEGMTTESLVCARTIHDRYHASRRNPWNEVECGDHYARAMASYGLFLTICGFEYHGPKGSMTFAPRLTPDDFRAAFTSAEGWGTFSQKRDGQTQHETIAVKWGRLRLRTLAFRVPKDIAPKQVTVTINGTAVESSFLVKDDRLTISLAADAVLEAGGTLNVAVA